MPLDLKTLRHVRALGRHGTFARAAEALGITQPALSRSIAELERTLGVLLFDRNKSGAYPTAYGLTVLQRGRHILASAAELERDVQMRGGLKTGTLTIAASVFSSQVSLVTAGARLLARHPGLSLRVLHPSEREIVDLLESKVADLALAGISRTTADSAFAWHPIQEYSPVFVCRPGHPLTTVAELRVDDLFAYPMAGPPCPPRIALRLREFPNAGNIDRATGDFVPSFCTNGPVEDWLAIVGCTDAIAGLPPRIALAHAATGSVVALPIALPWASIRYGFIFPKDRPLSLAAQALMEEIRSLV